MNDVEPADVTDPLDGDPRLPELFGAQWPRIREFHSMLTSEGPVRGLIGPRETSRLWERHLLNSAALAPLLGGGDSVIDLGSGAGLPGVVLAAMDPSREVTLLEPMARRVAWLEHVVATIGLKNVHVVRARADEVAGRLEAVALVARAVASLDKLYGWAAPLVAPGGTLLALKGSKAEAEVAQAAPVARRTGWTEISITTSSLLAGVEPATVVRARRAGGGRGVR